MQLFFKYAFSLGALFSFLLGLNVARDLQNIMLPQSAYDAVAGTVIALEQSRDDSEAHLLVHRIWFAYRAGGLPRQGGALSTACDECEAEDVHRITGRWPGQLAPGDPVTVYVRRDAPGTAYLGFATRAQQRGYWWDVALFLLVLPAVFLFFSRAKFSDSKED